MSRWLYGLEEEVFVTEPTRPTLESLYYLARLMWRNPRYYYSHTASNFARGGDIRQGLMSGIEVSTEPHATVDGLVEDLSLRRAELADVAQGLLVPLGALVDYEAPTNTCGVHIHIGPLPDADRVYDNLAYFLPLLMYATASSPFAGGGEFPGPSYRMANSYAIGPLRPDRFHRFQDLIFARRLGTLEVRALDPVWDLERVRAVLTAIDALVRHPGRLPFDRERYNRVRALTLARGYGPELEALRRELEYLCPAPEAIFAHAPAGELRQFWRRHGTLLTYAALDHAYRCGRLELREPPARDPSSLRALPKAAIGFAGYYMVRLPYIARKAWQEW